MAQWLVGTAYFGVLTVSLAIGARTSASTMPAVAAMTFVAKQVHRGKSYNEQHPHPVLRKPFHESSP
jgi:hypothetical protein